MNIRHFLRLTRYAALGCTVYLLGLALPTQVLAASNKFTEQQIIWQVSPNHYLAVENQTTTSAPLIFEHPIELTPETIYYYLTHVQMRRSATAQPTTVLADYNIDKLSREISQALSTITPNQFLRFVTHRVKRGFAGFGDTDLFTAGSIGVINGEVQIVLGDIDRQRDYGYEAIHNVNGNRPVTYDFDHGEFTRAHTKGVLFTALGQSVIQGAQNTSVVRFPIGKVSLPTPPPAPTLITNQDVTVSESTQKPRGISNTSRDENVLNVQPMKEVNHAAVTTMGKEQGVEDKLRLLKHLYEQDLITEQEYTQSKAKILSQL